MDIYNTINYYGACMNLRSVDLNLLTVLAVLLEERSVTAASKKLGMSQPAVSQALARLRALFKDELLVRVGRGLEATQRAIGIQPELAEVMAAIRHILIPEVFQPGTTIRSFTIACPDHMALLLGERLLPVLRSQAPGISIRFVGVSDAIRDEIVKRSLDLAVIAYLPELMHGLSIVKGFVDPIVCVVGSTVDHGASDLSALRVLAIEGAAALTPPSIETMEREPVSVEASHLIVLPLLANRAGTAAFVPRSMARLAQAHAAVRIIELEEGNRQLEHCVAWNPVDDSDAGHRWLRQIVIEELTSYFVI